MAKIGVIGSGGWGTALAILQDKNGHDVTMWSFFEEEIKSLKQNGENKLLPGIKINPSIKLTTDIGDMKQMDLCILAVPSFVVRSTAKLLQGVVKDDVYMVIVSKGLEDKTNKHLAQIVSEELPKAKVVVLSGPSHAEEVGNDVPTSLVAASDILENAMFVQDTLSNPNFRIYTSTDVIGVELGGAIKNIIALACGISYGLGLGDNTVAALMTRGIAEITRLGVAMGGLPQTFAGLSGIGDLIVTCMSRHSRNRRCGILVGNGTQPKEALLQVGTVEGYYAAKVIHDIAKEKNVDMPIVEQVYNVMYNGTKASDSLTILMTRPQKHESENF